MTQTVKKLYLLARDDKDCLTGCHTGIGGIGTTDVPHRKDAGLSLLYPS